METSNVETGDGETESMHTNERSSLQENFNQQQVSVCCVVCVVWYSAIDDPIRRTVTTEEFFSFVIFSVFVRRRFRH